MSTTQAKSKVDISRTVSPHSSANKLARVSWAIVYYLLFRLTPRPMYAWRRAILRLFGARIASTAKVFGSTKIWAPWNLSMGEFSCLSVGVEVLNVAPVTLDEHSTVSQYSYLCAATHDFEDPTMPVVSGPIHVGKGAWVCADVFVGPNVSIGDNAVVSARATVFEDVPSDMIAAGNPCRPIRKRF